MESFGFLKYLRGGVVAGNQRAAVAATTTIAASACAEDGGGGAGGGDVDDDASFFDLEFAVPGDESAASDAEEERVEFNFAVAGDDAAPGGGEVVALDASAGAETGDGKDTAEAAGVTAPAPPLPPASLLRPATKFRVMLLKLRKPKAAAAVPVEANGGAGAAAPKQASRFLIKFRVEDAPKLASLFTRDNSSRTSDAGVCLDRTPATAVAAQQPQDASAAAISAEERRFAKEVVLKYLSSKIKPLYVKVSRRYGERLRFGASEGEETDLEPDLSSPAPSPSPAPLSSQPPSSAAAATATPAAQPVVVACGVRAPRASVTAGLKQVCKRLGKSRSASSAVAAAPSPGAGGGGGGVAPQRRDDSLLQVQDGIQSAIAHCKRSFNASSKGTCTDLPPSDAAAA